MPVQCIYCASLHSADSFTRPEHVLPKAFGRFKGALTIFSVCENCNQHFGDTIDRELGRNSGEAIVRLLFGVKPVEEAHQVGGHRVELTFDDDSPLKGSRVILTASEDGRLVGKSPVQVGFRIPGQRDTKWFEEDELTSNNVGAYNGCENYVVGGTEEDWARVEQRLVDLGFSRQETLLIRQDEQSALSEVMVRVNYTIDRNILRAVAKIGFNYLAYRAGAAFCSNSDFDELRRFIRYGDGTHDDFVDLRVGPILLDEKVFGGRQTRGHLLTIDWHPRFRAPVGTVKLFNDIAYRIAFAEDVTLLWREIKGGHHFDIEDMSVDTVSAIRFPPY